MYPDDRYPGEDEYPVSPTPFQMKIQELVEEELATRHESMVAAMAQMTVEKKALCDKTTKLAREVSDLQLSLDKSTKQAYQSGRTEGVRDLCKGYLLSEDAWAPMMTSQEDICSFCSGQKKLEIINKANNQVRLVNCPQCSGTGLSTFWKNIPRKIKIAKIELTMTDHRYIQDYYSTSLTGQVVGTGEIYTGESFFQTEAECQAECDKRNAKK
jgi:hypothetical protein